MSQVPANRARRAPHGMSGGGGSSSRGRSTPRCSNPGLETLSTSSLEISTRFVGQSGGIGSSNNSGAAGRGEFAMTTSAVPLSASPSMGSSTAAAAAAAAAVCCAVSTVPRHVTSAEATHSPRPPMPWMRERQPHRLNAPPRLAPLAGISAGDARCGGPATAATTVTGVRPRAPRHGRVDTAAVTVGRTTRSPLRPPLAPLVSASQTVLQQHHRQPPPHLTQPELLWRRSKPLTRLPTTTVSRTMTLDTTVTDELSAALAEVRALNTLLRREDALPAASATQLKAPPPTQLAEPPAVVVAPVKDEEREAKTSDAAERTPALEGTEGVPTTAGESAKGEKNDLAATEAEPCAGTPFAARMLAESSAAVLPTVLAPPAPYSSSSPLVNVLPPAPPAAPDVVVAEVPAPFSPAVNTRAATAEVAESADAAPVVPPPAEVAESYEDVGAVTVSSTSSSSSSLGELPPLSVAVDGVESAPVFWAHEAPLQPAYAQTHQLPALFSALVQELTAARPPLDVHDSGDPLLRWARSWFESRYASQQQQQAPKKPPLPRATLAPQMPRKRVSDVSSIDVPASPIAADMAHDLCAAGRAGDGATEVLAFSGALVGRSRGGGGSSAAAAVAALSGNRSGASASARRKPSASSLFANPAASSPHAYVPLTAEYVRSGRQSRTTSGTSQRSFTPRHSPAPPPPSSTSQARAALSSGAGSGSSSASLERHARKAAADGAGALLQAVSTPTRAPPASAPQPPLQAPPPTSKPLSGGARVTAPPLTRSPSSKQTAALTAVLASVSGGAGGSGGVAGGGGGGDGRAGGRVGSGPHGESEPAARPRLTSPAYAVMASASTASLAAKEAAHAHP